MSLIWREKIMKYVVVAAMLLFATPALSQEILKVEPGPGMLGAGQTVLVDDGSCGRGKIKQVTGGSNRTSGGKERKGGSGRVRTCVAKR